MKKLFIIKTGTTFPATKKLFGDFDCWTKRVLGVVDIDIHIVDAENGEALPETEDCAGAVITGSHSMVTDNEPWSLRLENWTALLLKSCVPLFGVCYGHQLLARAAGGRAGFHPKGREIGTEIIYTLPDCKDDPVFNSLEESFSVNVTHLQTVLDLPKNAVRLAYNMHEPNHAFRVGKCAWGVQFHPEYNAGIMKSYIMEQANDLEQDGVNVALLLKSVSETPVSAQLLEKFAGFVSNKSNNVEP